MKSVSLTAFPRELRKRNGVKKVRATGRIPAVIYGRHNQPQNLELASRDLENLIHAAASEIVLVDLSIQNANGAKRLALVKDIQHHPLSGQMLHVDMQEVAENEKVTVMVPIETSGEAVGVKTGGGVLEHVLFKVKVRATPRDLPEVITLDVTTMEIGKSIHIGEIPPIPGVEILGHKEAPVVSVAAPISEAAETAATATAEGAPTQPEMIKEKKEEGAAAAGEAKAGEKGAEKGGEKKAAEKKK
jgi:large subunit ribosomal protein L25